MKILIIDDNRKITEMFESYFKLKGHDVTVSNDGRNGLSLIESCHFDVVVLDIAMPDFSGFDVVNALQKDGKIDDEKIIILTASPLSTSESDMLIEKGVHSILKKPVNMQVLLQTLTGN